MNRMLFPVIRKYFKMLVSIMLVSAMGCGIMTGLSGAYVSLETSLDDYVENYRYPNAVITTDVTSRKNIDKLKEIKSVSQINVRLCGDTYIKSKEGRYLSVRVFSSGRLRWQENGGNIRRDACWLLRLKKISPSCSCQVSPAILSSIPIRVAESRLTPKSSSQKPSV